jgi:DNA-binding transcriptional LysR family regulator
MLDPRRLRILLAVAEEKSFTAAAQRLSLTQSAVSQQMATLERETGVTLLTRTPQGVSLTEAGSMLAEGAYRLLAEIRAVEAELLAAGDTRPEIRLGGFSSAGLKLLPQALRAFRASLPDVRVSLVSLPSGDITTALRDGVVHVFLTWEYSFAPQPLNRRVAQFRLLDDPLLAVLPSGHRLSSEPEIALADLAGEPWLTRAHGEPYENAYETMCRIAGFEPDIAFRADGYESLQGLVAAGLGVSVAPALSLVPRRPDVVVRPISRPAFSRQVSALTLIDGSQTAPLADFMAILRQSAEEVRGAIGQPLRRDFVRAVRELPARTREVAGVPLGVALQVILMLGLGLPERASRRHLGDHLARPQPGGVDVGDRVLGDPLLGVAQVEDGRPVTGPDVVALPVHRGRIVNLEEELQQVPVRNLLRVEDDLNRLGVTAVVAVGRVRHVTAGVTDPRLEHARELPDEVLHAPEAAAGEDGLLSRHDALPVLSSGSNSER